jgi:simple sugar transport system permease protein
MIGEYFRQFIGYGVIALSLVLYAWKSRKAVVEARAGLRRGAGDSSSATGKGGKA